MIRPAFGFLLKFLSALTGAAVLLALAAAWRLSTGAVDLDMLTPYVEEWANETLPEFRFSVSATKLQWSREDNSLSLLAEGIELRQPGGKDVLSIPEMSLGLDLAALLRGRAEIREMTFYEPQLTVVRDSEGAIKVDVGNGRLRDLRDILARFGPAAQADIRARVTLRRARITLDDRMSGEKILAEDVDFSLGSGVRGVFFSFDAGLALGDARLNASGYGLLNPAENLYNATFRGRIGRLADLAGHYGMPPWIAGLELPADFNAELKDEGRKLNFNASFGKGQVRLRDFFPKPLAIDRLEAVGQIDLPGRKGEITAVKFAAGPMRGRFRGRAAYSAEGLVSLKGKGSIDDIALTDFMRFWPSRLASDAYDWVAAHMREGMISDASLAVDFNRDVLSGRKPAGADALTVDYRFAGAVAEDLPWDMRITDAEGVVRLTAEAIDITVDTARMGDVTLREGRFLATGFQEEDQAALIEGTAEGPLQSFFDRLEKISPGLLAENGVQARPAGGVAAVRANIAFPLTKTLRDEQIDYKIAGSTEGAVIRLRGLEDPLREGRVAFRVDRKKTTVKGTASLRDTLVSLDILKQGGAGLQGRIGGRLPLERFADFLGPVHRYVSGYADLSANFTDLGRQGVVVDIDADVTDTAIVLSPLPYGKAASVPGRLRLRLLNTPAGRRISGLKLAGRGIDIEGSADLDGQNNLLRLDLSRVVLGDADKPVNDLRISYLRSGPGQGPFLSVAGRIMDAAPLVEKLFAGDNAASLPPGLDRLMLSADIGLLHFDRDLALGNLKAVASLQGDRITELKLSGSFSADAPLQASIRPEGDRRQLRLRAANAGNFLRALNIYDNMQGGRLAINAVIEDTQPDRPVRGFAVIENFRISNAPVLAQLLSVASLSGIGELLRGEGISFNRAEAPFTYARGRIAFNKARAAGSAIGLTAQGTYDVANEAYDIKGTIIPAYTINSVLGKIPLLGNLLVGRKGEGVFGVNYLITGTAEDPNVTVNPLSALAPGILRRMFLEPLTGAFGGKAPSAAEDENFSLPDR